MKPYLVVPLALCLAAVACQRAPKEAPAAPSEQLLEAVPTALARRHDVPLTFVARGTLQPTQRAQITAGVAGRLQQLRLQPGLRVRHGEVVARLDATPHRLRRARAVAELARCASARTQAQRRHRRRQLARRKNPALVSEEAWELAQADLHAAQASFAVARAELAQASWALAQTQVRAPCAGVVAAVSRDLGSYLDEGSALGALSREMPAHVRFFVPSQVARGVTPGQKIEVVDSTVAAGSVAGTVTHVAADADFASKQVEVLARLAAPLAVFPQDHVTVQLAAPADAGATWLPPGALVERDEGRGVFVVDAANTLQFRAVDPLVRGDDGVVVRGGVRPGEAVVTEVSDRLQAGMQVRPQAVTEAP